MYIKYIILVVIILYICFKTDNLYEIFKIRNLSNVDWSKYDLFRMSNNRKVTKINESLIIVDNFYANPDKIRKYCLDNKDKFKTIFPLYKSNVYNPMLNYDASYSLIKYFKNLSKQKVNKGIWNYDILKESNGYFQFITKNANPVIHYDRHWGVIIFLHPNPEKNSGTNFYKNKKLKISKAMSIDEAENKYNKNQIDKINVEKKKSLWKEGEKSKFNRWEKTFEIENKYNRALIFDGRNFHCSQGGFGDKIENSRLFQTFFFAPI